MNDLHVGVVVVHAAKPQVVDDLLRHATGVFEQDSRLLELRGQNVPVVRVPGNVRAPTISPLPCVTATLAFTPNS